MLKSARQPQVIWLALLCAWLQELHVGRHHWEEEVGDRKQCVGVWEDVERKYWIKMSQERLLELLRLSDENDYPALTEPPDQTDSCQPS